MVAWLALAARGDKAVAATSLGRLTSRAPTDSPEHRKYAPVREVDIRHIAIDLTPDFKARSLAATTEVKFKPLADGLRELKLDAVALRVVSVTGTEPIQAWQNTDDRIIVTFAQALPVDRETAVTVQYTAEPTAGLYFRTPEMGYRDGDTHLFTQGESITARNWFPCFDAPNDKFTSEVTCHVPEGMTAIANGRLASESQDVASGLVAFRWVQEQPHSSYLIALAAGYFRKLEDAYRGIPLTFYTPPSEFAHAQSSFAGTKDMLAYFEEETGTPYPWAKYAQVCVNDFVAGGMENTSLTILTDNTLFPPETQNLRSSEGLVSHELAHQWFGDLVTCKDWTHLWLNEGFASYYEALYDGHRHGRDAFLYNLWHKARNVLDQANDIRPIAWRGFDQPDEQFSYLAYPKGAWVLHMLRCQLGEALYRRCIQTYLARHAYGNVVTDDLNAVVSELSGRSFDQFFDQWVYHAHHPELEVGYSWDEQTRLAKLNVKQVQLLSENVLLFNFPLPVRFKTKAGLVDRTLTVKAKDEDFYVALPAAPETVRIDPDLTVLAKIRFSPPQDLLLAQLADATDMPGRLLAVEALSGRQDNESIAKLKQVLNRDAFYGVRIEAAKALRASHTDEALDALLASTNQPDARVRQQVCADVAGFYRATALETARATLASERNPDVLVEAIRALGPYGSADTRETLLRFLATDSFRNVLADAAIGAMRAQDDPVFIQPLLAALQERETAFTSGDFGQALGALAYLARNEEKKETVREFLVRQTGSPRRRVQRAAIAALGSLGDPKAIAVLRTFASAAKDSPERKAAEKAIADLRADRKPSDDLRDLRDEVAGLQRENRELRRSVDDLKKQFTAVTVNSSPEKAAKTKKRAKKSRKH